jgi:5'-nucleotidase
VKEPVGGAARFVTKVQSYREGGSAYDGHEPLVLFSGDAFNPSITSTVTKGKQMVPALNAIGIQAAVYGNHDFDFGLENLETLVAGTNFPWLMSNVRAAHGLPQATSPPWPSPIWQVQYKPTGRALADGLESLVVEWGGRKIGLLGLVEWEWMATLATISEEDEP